jgi:hypothetical protein
MGSCWDTYNEIEAIVGCDLLKDRGIECLLYREPKEFANILAGDVPGTLKYSIMVPESQVHTAHRLLEQLLPTLGTEAAGSDRGRDGE